MATHLGRHCLRFGVGLVLAALTTVVVQNVPPTQTAVMTGVNPNIRAIGSGSGVALMTAIITRVGESGSIDSPATMQSYIVGFLVMACIGLAATVVMMAGRRQVSHVAESANAVEPIPREAITD
ncbi:hypothetical protein ACTU3I_04680 [Microbacterium sp. RD1]|uniref:hypothetical protein n=1 Tax=Microbacterium sp. RD1 TaxID=3457313 RepID=UPI003FA5BEB8